MAAIGRPVESHPWLKTDSVAGHYIDFYIDFYVKDESVCVATKGFGESIQLLELGKWTRFELSREFDKYILSLAIGGVEVVNAEDEFK